MRLFFAALATAGLLSAAEANLGKPLTLKQPVAIAALLAKPADYAGKTVQVKGKISEVCQMAGCWIDLTDTDGKKIRIKVNDGEIEFPKDAVGKTALAEGTFVKEVLTREEAVERAKEEAKESGKKFDPESIKSGTTSYRIQGTGAVILAN
jgi:hypothetical protein